MGPLQVPTPRGTDPRRGSIVAAVVLCLGQAHVTRDACKIHAQKVLFVGGFGVVAPFQRPSYTGVEEHKKGQHMILNHTDK